MFTPGSERRLQRAACCVISVVDSSQWHINIIHCALMKVINYFLISVSFSVEYKLSMQIGGFIITTQTVQSLKLYYLNQVPIKSASGSSIA